MNYLNEEDYIKAINDNPENRDYQLLFAEYLQETGEDNLAEGWRVLIEKGKKPELWTLGKTPHMETSPEWIGWNWETTVSHNLSMNLFDVIPEKMDTDHPLTEKAFPTFFGAMQAAAVAYVRHTYDENYGKPVIHFIAYKNGTETGMDCHFDLEEREETNGIITRRPTFQSNHVSYTNLGYDPEESYLIRQAIIDGEPILVEIELEDGEAIGKTKVRLRHFEALPDNLCNVELTTEETKPKDITELVKICPVCEGSGGLNHICPNCGGEGHFITEGKGVTG